MSQTPIQFETGGLGHLMVVNVYEVWVCVAEHACSDPIHEYFCWVVDETKANPHENAPNQYVAWGNNKDLELVTRQQDAAPGSHYSKTQTKLSSKTAPGASEKAHPKTKAKKPDAQKTSAVNSFDSWGVREVCKLVRSIGSSFEAAAVAMEENGIDGPFFLEMLANNDEDLTTSIPDGGLGFTRLQLKRVADQIERHN